MLDWALEGTADHPLCTLSWELGGVLGAQLTEDFRAFSVTFFCRKHAVETDWGSLQLRARMLCLRTRPPGRGWLQLRGAELLVELLVELLEQSLAFRQKSACSSVPFRQKSVAFKQKSACSVPKKPRVSIMHARCTLFLGDLLSTSEGLTQQGSFSAVAWFPDPEL